MKNKTEWWVALILSITVMMGFGIYLIELGNRYCAHSQDSVCGFYMGACMWLAITLAVISILFSLWRESL